MSVVAGDRKETDFDYYDLTMQLNFYMNRFLMYNFGTSTSYKDIKFFENRCKMSDEDKSTIETVIDKYNNKISFESSYPYWALEHHRTRILEILDRLVDHVVSFSTLYSKSIELHNLKQRHINEAICECQILLTEFQNILMVFNNANFDLSVFDAYIDLINKLIRKLREARTRSNGQKVYAIQAEMEDRLKANINFENGIRVYTNDGLLKSSDQYRKEIAEFNKAYDIKPLNSHNKDKDVTVISKPIIDNNSNNSIRPGAIFC